MTAKFSEPITSFRDSINASSVVLRSYYTQLNTFERELYLDERLYDPSKEVLYIDQTGALTPLAGRSFSAESIKARTDALVLIGLYAERLGELAGSDAPRRFAEASQVLGTNLSSLTNTFEQLGKDDAEKKLIDASAKNYGGPIGTIVGVVGRLYLEQQRDKAIREALDKGAPAVRQVLELLQADLATVIQPLQQTGLKQQLADRVTSYNDRRRTSDFDRRRAMLADIASVAERYNAAVAANPSNLIEDMRLAHESLVKYAASSRAPQDFAELVGALETFRNSVKEIAAAVVEIRGLKGGINK